MDDLLLNRGQLCRLRLLLSGWSTGWQVGWGLDRLGSPPGLQLLAQEELDLSVEAAHIVVGPLADRG
jgi:hypothetical protein